MAQNRTVSGKVTDSKDGSPLIGASVVAKGSTVGAITDVNGTFKLSVPATANTLVVTYIGYVRKEVPVTSDVTNVTLDAVNNSLNEVLVVGYGTVRKKDATGAVVKISSGDFVQGVTTDPLQQLQGKAAGVVITTSDGDPNSTASVRIRGTASLSGGQDPLYVIDGVAGADIHSVAPNDIESFDILKDASAAAIYGSRAAAGVILVTTKTGKAGKTQVSVNTYVASESPEHLVQFMDRTQYLSAYQSFYGHSMPVFDPAKPSTTSDQGANTNWFKAITRTGFTHNENLALSGGSEKSHYRGSLTYTDQQGIALNSGRKDLNGRFNFDQKTLDDKLLITLNVAATHTNSNYVANPAWLDAASVPSVISIYDPLKPGQYQAINNTQEANPVPFLTLLTNVGATDRLSGNLRFDYTLVKGLIITPYANATRATTNTNLYYPPSGLLQPVIDQQGFTPASISNHGDVDKGATTVTDETYGITLNYKGEFGKSRLNLLGGYEYNSYNYTGFRVLATDFNDINLPNENINAANAVTPSGIGSYYNGYILHSLFGRVEYNFNDKYYLTANVRYDQSNKLGINNQGEVFPSFSAAWTISNEDFMKDIKWITSLKLRGGYGLIGNQDAITPYLSQFLFGPNNKTYYDGASGKFLTSNFAIQNQNKDIRWEVRSTTDVAIDFSLFDGRLNGSFDYYNSTTDHLLYPYSVPLGGQFFVPTIIANIGSLSNKGFDFSVNYRIISSKDFSWTAGANASFNRNKILNLSGQFAGNSFNVVQRNVGSTSGLGISGAISAIAYLKVGYPVGTLLLPEYAGQYSGPIAAAKGKQEFYYQNTATGKRDTTSDVSKLNYADNGSTQDRKFYTTDPKFTYGISNTFTYKQFDLTIFLRGQYGSKGFNETAMDYSSLQKLGTYAVLANAQSLGITSSSEPSNYWLQSTSFLKIQNATLGYSVGVKNSRYIDKLHLYIAGNNLYTFTSYKGLDPELNTVAALNNSSAGIDTRTLYPRSRQISFGINLILK
ncbi:MAG: TonB-dependent starch-binding outer membrane protein SusC [Mucilaginibacter sp.]|nr:TonB-dependent starch-binding outer membrane protein SusC [Mucilaginibacter sp.]